MTIVVYDGHTGSFQGDYATVQTFGQILAGGLAGGTGAAVDGGVAPALGDPLAYSLVSGRSALLKAGRYVLPSSNPAYGAYEIVVPTDQTVTHAAADASQSRTDRIVAICKNTGVIADDYCDIRVIEGSPGGGLPALPGSLGAGNVHELWRVTMPAGGPSTALTGFVDYRKWLVTGVASVPGAGATPSLAAYLPPGALVWDRIAGKLYIRDTGSGLVRDVPAGLVRDHGVWTGSVTIPPAIRYDAVSSPDYWTAQAGESYQPSASPSGALLNLGAGRIYSVRQKVVFPALSSPYTAYDGMLVRIERNSDHYQLAAKVVDGRIREGNTPVVNLEIPNIYSNVDSTLKFTIDNPFPAGGANIGPITSTLWVTGLANL